MKMSLAERLDAYSAPDSRGCLVWQRSTVTNGYGSITGSTSAHRAAYELFYGPIPAGLTIDHICRNRRCVNPLHLDAVTHRENMQRSWSVRRTWRVPGLIKTSEAAAILGVDKVTVNRYARRSSNRLPTALKSDGIRGPRWFRRSDVIAFRDQLAGERAA